MSRAQYSIVNGERTNRNLRYVTSGWTVETLGWICWMVTDGGLADTCCCRPEPCDAAGDGWHIWFGWDAGRFTMSTVPPLASVFTSSMLDRTIGGCWL